MLARPPQKSQQRLRPVSGQELYARMGLTTIRFEAQRETLVLADNGARCVGYPLSFVDTGTEHRASDLGRELCIQRRQGGDSDHEYTQYSHGRLDFGIRNGLRGRYGRYRKGRGL